MQAFGFGFFLLSFFLYPDLRKVELPRWLTGKESTCQCRRHKKSGFDPWVGKILWSRKWQPTPVFSPRKFHGQRTLVDSPWDYKRVGHDLATEHTHTLKKVTSTQACYLSPNCKEILLGNSGSTHRRC